MASCMMGPSHYLKQCGIIIKLINEVLWHLSQWISLKTPRYQSVKWDWNLYIGIISSQALKSLIYSAVIIVLFVIGEADTVFIVTIFNPSGLCLLKGNKVPSPCVFCDHTTGGNVPRTYLLHEESVTWKIMASSVNMVKAKIWKWLVN